MLMLLFFSTTVFGKSYFYRSWGQQYEKKSSYFELSSSYWMSMQRVDLAGVKTKIPSDQSFNEIRGKFLLNYSFFTNLQIGLKADAKRTAFLSGTDSYTSSSIDSVSILFKYLLPAEKRWHLGIEFIYNQKMFKNNDILAVPIGDDINSMTLSGVGSYHMTKSSLLNFSLGFHRYAELQSSEITYRIEWAKLFRFWDIFVGVSGVHSLKKDLYTADPSAKPPIGIYASNMHNSINQEYVNASLGIIKKWKNWGIKLEVGGRFLGKSTDLGYWGGFSLIRVGRGQSSDKGKKQAFKEYDIEGEVLKVSPRGKFVKVNIGLAKDLDTSMRVDFYKMDFFGENILVATGVVQELKASWSIIKIIKKYHRMKIEKGWVARAY